MLISPQAMTFQKINNVTAYPQHKSDKTDHEILQYHLRGGGGGGGRGTMNTTKDSARNPNPEVLHKVRHGHLKRHFEF